MPADRPADGPARRRNRQVTFGLDKHERDDILLTVGERLRRARIAARLSQQGLAVRCFMRVDRVSAYERGMRVPDLIALLMFEQRLGVSVEDFAGGLLAPTRRAGTAQLLDLVAREPGLSTDAIAASLRLPSWYVTEIALY